MGLNISSVCISATMPTNGASGTTFFSRRHLTLPPFPMVRVYREETLSEKKFTLRNKICCAAPEGIDDYFFRK